MPFHQAVFILKRQDRTIKGVQVWYSDQVEIKWQVLSFGIHTLLKISMIGILIM